MPSLFLAALSVACVSSESLERPTPLPCAALAEPSLTLSVSGEEFEELSAEGQELTVFMGPAGGWYSLLDYRVTGLVAEDSWTLEASAAVEDQVLATTERVEWWPCDCDNGWREGEELFLFWIAYEDEWAGTTPTLVVTATGATGDVATASYPVLPVLEASR